MSQSELKEYRVIWQVKPYMHNPRRVVFVKAENESGASALARDWVERTAGLERSEFIVIGAYAADALPSGKIVQH